MAAKTRRRTSLAIGAVLATLLLISHLAIPRMVESRLNRVRNAHGYSPSQRALNLHTEMPVADLHADSLLFGRNLLAESGVGHVDLPRLQKGNVRLQLFTVVTKVPRGLNIERNSGESDPIRLLAIVDFWPVTAWNSPFRRALCKADRLKRFAMDSEGKMAVVTSRDELRATVQSGSTVAAVLGIEGAQALDGDGKNLSVLRDAGYRTLGLAHFYDNEFAGSAHGLKKYGLTDSGRQLVRDAEAAGIILDLAHASARTIDDVLAMAHRPVLVSHTGVKGTCDNARNLSDGQLRAIAQQGGLIGIGFWQTAVCGSDAKAIARAIRYAARIVGVEHVALGSDFDGAVTTPFDTSQMVLVTDALLQEGFTDDQVRNIMGGNAIRFFEQNLP